MASASAVPRKHVGRQDGSDNVAKMRNIVDVGKRTRNEHVPPARFGQDWAFGSLRSFSHGKFVVRGR